MGQSIVEFTCKKFKIGTRIQWSLECKISYNKIQGCLYISNLPMVVYSDYNITRENSKIVEN